MHVTCDDMFRLTSLCGVLPPRWAWDWTTAGQLLTFSQLFVWLSTEEMKLHNLPYTYAYPAEQKSGVADPNRGFMQMVDFKHSSE